MILPEQTVQWVVDFFTGLNLSSWNGKPEDWRCRRLDRISHSGVPQSQRVLLLPLQWAQGGISPANRGWADLLRYNMTFLPFWKSRMSGSDIYGRYLLCLEVRNVPFVCRVVAFVDNCLVDFVHSSVTNCWLVKSVKGEPCFFVSWQVAMLRMHASTSACVQRGLL